MNGAQALFKALTEAGLDICLANRGTSEMQLLCEMGRTENVSAVLCLEEGFHYNRAGDPLTRLISDAVDIAPKYNRFGSFALLVSLYSLWG